MRICIQALFLGLAMVLSVGCGGSGENTVVEGELTPEQEAERNNVALPASPSSSPETSEN